MRIGDQSFYLRFLSGLSQARSDSEDGLRSLADGKRVRTASDDPVAAREALDLRTRLTRILGFDRAAHAARADLGTIDDVFRDLTDLLTEARSEALAGASGTSVGAGEERALAIDALRGRLQDLANKNQGDRHLFGGTLTDTAPFAADGTYLGNDDEVTVALDDSASVGATLSGRRVFLDGGDLFTVLDDLAQALRDGRLSDVATAAGQLDTALDHVSTVRADVGARLNRIDRVLESHGDETVRLTGRIEEIENVDLAEVVTRIQSAETTGNALSAAAARVLGRSLFDFLG